MHNPPGLSGEPTKTYETLEEKAYETPKQKKEDATEVVSSFCVTRMGLEPMTPTLKVLCSTN